MTWIHNKLKCTGCVQLLHDIQLTNSTSFHLVFLKNFLQRNFKPLNYDAQQVHSLLHTRIKKDSATTDSIIQTWTTEIEEGKIIRVEKINDGVEEEVDAELSDSNQNGYDFLINSNQDENFVVSLSTDREEICVWNVLECSRVRTLKGIPQPTSVCPVGKMQI